MKKIIKILKKGGIIAYPTDTVYGLGADIFNERSVRKIFEIKERPLASPVSILVSDADEIKKYAYLENKEFIEELKQERMLPGHLTLILKKKSRIPDIVTGGRKTVGIRIPDCEIALNITKKLGQPITTTSANISSDSPVSNSENLDKKIKNRVDYIIEGKCKYGKPSTIIDLTGKIRIIRRGVKSKETEDLIKKMRLWSSGRIRASQARNAGSKKTLSL